MNKQQENAQIFKILPILYTFNSWCLNKELQWITLQICILRIKDFLQLLHNYSVLRNSITKCILEDVIPELFQIFHSRTDIIKILEFPHLDFLLLLGCINQIINALMKKIIFHTNSWINYLSKKDSKCLFSIIIVPFRIYNNNFILWLRQIIIAFQLMKHKNVFMK